MDIDPVSRDLAIRTMIGEVDPNDPDAGRAAVASTILNRVKAGTYGKTVGDVVTARGQFEPWSRNPRALMAIDPGSADYQRNAKIFDAVAAGTLGDPTGGATHFYSPQGQAALGRRAPDWSRAQPTAVIGGHRFYAPQGTAEAQPDLLGSWGGAPAPAAPAPAAAGDDLLGSWNAGGAPASAPETTGRPDLPHLVVTPKDVPLPSPAPAAPTASSGAPGVAPGDEETLPQYVARLQAESSGPGFGNAAVRLGAGVMRGVGDVADTLATGIAGAGAGGANLLARLGVISPATAENVGTWAGGVGQDIAADNALYAKAAGDSRLAEVGRIGGQVAGTAPLLGAAGEVAAIPVNAISRASPYIAQTLAQPGALLRGAQVIGGGAAAGAGAAALTSSASDQPLADQIKSGAEAGAILGPAGAMAARAGASIVSPAVDAGTAALARLARNTYDIPVTAGQISSNHMVRIADSVLQRMPFSGYAARTEAQQTGLNRAISNTFGENAEHVTPDVMANARDRIGNAFDSVAARTSINADNQFGIDLHNTVQDAAQVLTPEELRPLINQVRNVVGRIDPTTNAISGDAYQALTRRGAPLDRTLQSQNPNMRYYAGQIREALDDAMERSSPPDLVNELRTARAQWRAMRTIQPLVEKSPTGDLSPALLLGAARAAEGRGTRGMAYGGGGALADLARIGQRFLKEPGSSNTSERLLAMKTLGYLGGGALGLGGTYAFDPENFQRNALLGLGGLAAARAGSAALRSNALSNLLIQSGLRGPLPLPAIPFPGIAAPAGALAARPSSSPQSP
jgi:hypothetical protein